MREPTGFSLKGWKIVAGGRSAAKTTGYKATEIEQPGGLQERILAPRRGAVQLLVTLPVVFAALRPPATICQPFRLEIKSA